MLLLLGQEDNRRQMVLLLVLLLKKYHSVLAFCGFPRKPKAMVLLLLLHINDRGIIWLYRNGRQSWCIIRYGHKILTLLLLPSWQSRRMISLAKGQGNCDDRRWSWTMMTTDDEVVLFLDKKRRKRRLRKQTSMSTTT